MNKTRSINVVCVALFAGIILTMAFYFGISAFTQSAPPPEEAGNTVGQMTFGRFSNAFYNDKSLEKLNDKTNYYLFGSIDSKDIILGDNDFLFDAGKEPNGYDYIADYTGEAGLSEKELKAFESILLLRQLAYKNRGVDYLMVVIPNSQTIYSEYMPSYMGKLSKNTRLAQLGGYMESNGYNFFFDATDVLLEAKANGKLLYNNTENSLNSLGEWYLYDAVREKLEQYYNVSGEEIGLSALDLYTRSTDGKKLARRAGVSSLILNETISLSNSVQTRYTVSDYYGTMVSTNMTDDGTESRKKDVILLEFTDEWDRILLMPYFSNTYANVTYKNNHQFSSLAVDNLKPNVVVQFIHENEIYDLMDSNVLLTYNSGLRFEIDDKVTSPPLLISQSFINDHTVCIAGEAEPNAYLTVKVDGEIVKVERAIGDLFFVSVDMEDREAVDVSINARAINKKAPYPITPPETITLPSLKNIIHGRYDREIANAQIRLSKYKQMSEPINFTIRRNENAKQRMVTVGSNSELYSTDYSWINFLSDEQICAVSEGLEQKIKSVKNLTGRDTEYIYLIVPDKLTVYPDDAPDELKNGVLPVLNKYRETVREVRENAGMTVIDLTEDMINHKVLSRLYCQTDMLWTGFGSYVGYHSLISEIAKKFSAVKVHELSDFTAITEENVCGELMTRLGIDGAVVSEKYLTLQRWFESKSRFEQSGGGAFDITQAFVSYNDNKDLPVAIVTRDTYGTGMLENMSEHFSKMIVLREDEYTISNELISEIKPDYIITIRCNGELS